MCDCASNQGFTTLDSCSAARSAPFWCSWSDTHCQVPDCVSTLDVFDPVTPVIVRCKLSGWHHGISPPTPPFRNHVPAFSSLKSLDEFRNTFWKLARPPRWLLQRAFCDLAPPLDGFCNPLPDGFCYTPDGFCDTCLPPRWLLLRPRWLLQRQFEIVPFPSMTFAFTLCSQFVPTRSRFVPSGNLSPSPGVLCLDF